ncbi:nucleoside deaminase [bacterium]|nr:nucleoside deaminase [bacterium]
MAADQSHPLRGWKFTPPLRKTIGLPGWVRREVDFETLRRTDAAKMRLAIGLAAANVRHGTGGPFGAAVFDGRDHRLLSVGVNAVVPGHCSVSHAEILALILAESELKNHRLDLAGGKPGRFVLASSSQPCVMCFGAILWAGVDRLIYGSTKADVEKISGFDEGPLPADWKRECRRRGIRVAGPLLRSEAAGVLKTYADGSGIVY